ncbi:MAG: hypothetical protein AAB353_03295 [Candidatus Hydrogenedentota bacterium]
MGSSIGVDQFVWLGLANGAGALAYLLAVYAFMRVAAPKVAGLAFVLFTLGGGVGGVVHFAALATGAAATPPVWLQRAVMYELIEGSYLSPALHTARLYYSLSLAFAFASLAMYWRGIETRNGRRLAFSAFLLFWGALINVRFGAFAWGVALIYTLRIDGVALRDRLRYALTLGPSVALAASMTWMLQSRSPVFGANTAALVRETMWLTPLLNAAGPLLALACFAIVPALKLKTRRTATWPLAGYLAVFAGLYLSYQLYYGNFTSGAESKAGIFASDWALIGGLAGLLGALRFPRRRPKPPADSGLDSAPPVWIVIWLLLYSAIAVSAWGQGWFLRLTPQRLMVFIGIPMSMLAAYALFQLRDKRLRSALVLVLVGCGVASIVAGRLFILSPPALGAAAGAFGRLHPEFISREDAALLESLGRGIVLAPWDFSDVIALRPETRVIGGAGSTDLSDQKSVELRPIVDAFFSPAATDSARNGIAQEWCIDFVYCPDVYPVAEETMAALEGAHWLRPVAKEGKGALFAVVR